MEEEGGRVERETGVILDDEEGSCGTGDGSDGSENGFCGGAGEHVTANRSGQHARTHIARVCRFVAGAPAWRPHPPWTRYHVDPT